MRDRANINYPSEYGPGYAYDFDYSFAYASKKAIVTRSFKIVGKTQSVPTQKFECLLNAYGYCTAINLIGTDPEHGVERLSIEYQGNRMKRINTNFSALVGNENEPYHEFWGSLDVVNDSLGNVTRIYGGSLGYGGQLDLNYTYNTKAPGKLRMYQPTQYLINQWFTMLEVMQWVPMQVSERRSVNFEFSNLNATHGTASMYVYHIKQGQSYLNHQYDANGNLISYTYSDKVLQKIGWK